MCGLKGELTPTAMASELLTTEANNELTNILIELSLFALCIVGAPTLPNPTIQVVSGLVDSVLCTL